MKASGDLRGGWHSRAVEELNAGRGTGNAPWNPLKIITALRQLVRWSSPKTLRKHKTRLRCPAGHGIQQVIDAYPNSTCRLLCGCRRAVSDITSDEYRTLVSLAEGLKPQGATA
jgi:hypothetical protein